VAAFVLLAAVARALGVAANLARLGLHGPLLIAESAGAGRRMIVVPVGPSGHYFPIVLNPAIENYKFIIPILQLQRFPDKRVKLSDNLPVAPGNPASRPENPAGRLTKSRGILQ